MARAGRPTKYRSWFPIAALDLARQGMTDKMIAEHLNITPLRLINFKKQHPTFKKAILKGRIPVDAQVESALLRTALGYEYDEISETVKTSPRGRITRTMQKTRKQVLPNITAQKFWLLNRRPARWRDKAHHQHTGEVKLLFDSRLAQV